MAALLTLRPANVMDGTEVWPPGDDALADQKNPDLNPELKSPREARSEKRSNRAHLLVGAVGLEPTTFGSQRGRRP